MLGGADDPATRLENRIGEPAANPYLYMASQSLAGLDGVDRALDPGPSADTPYETKADFLPKALQEAVSALDADPFFREALAYCEEHDVATFGNCARGHYALGLLAVGRWDEALAQARDVLATRASPINRLTSLITAGLVTARRGEPDANTYLAEARSVALGVDEPQYLAWALLACGEAAWLRGDDDAPACWACFRAAAATTSPESLESRSSHSRPARCWPPEWSARSTSVPSDLIPSSA